MPGEPAASERLYFVGVGGVPMRDLRRTPALNLPRRKKKFTVFRIRLNSLQSRRDFHGCASKSDPNHEWTAPRLEYNNGKLDYFYKRATSFLHSSYYNNARQLPSIRLSADAFNTLVRPAHFCSCSGRPAQTPASTMHCSDLGGNRRTAQPQDVIHARLPTTDGHLIALDDHGT